LNKCISLFGNLAQQGQSHYSRRFAQQEFDQTLAWSASRIPSHCRLGTGLLMMSDMSLIKFVVNYTTD